MNDETSPMDVSLPAQDLADTDVCLRCSDNGCGGNNCCRTNLHSTNWLADIPDNDDELVEVVFKNTRRGFYRNSAHLPLSQGDWVAVEATPGHDIGQVGLTGVLARRQMQRVGFRRDTEILRVFRKAREADMERFEQARSREVDTMIRSRKIAADLGLKMKIGDVEYQGDGNKAIFYYIADGRVDFRQLIKVLAEVFKIRVEMKQIGARQEAGRIGGIGPCGRPMCCASWMNNFVSVSTVAARFQDVSLNPQKLAGQCAKLKCCLNFEVDTYVEASKKMPPRDVQLHTADKDYYFFKADVLRGEVTYSLHRNTATDTVTITVARAFEVIEMNNNGVKPEKLQADSDSQPTESAFGDILGQDAINRFDKKKKKKNKKSDKPLPAEGNEDAPNRRRADTPRRGTPQGNGNKQPRRDGQRNGHRHSNKSQKNGGNETEGGSA